MVDDKTQSFVKKHARTSEQIADDIRKLEDVKKDLTQDSASLDANLREFNSIEDPILNPNNGKPMCWVRRPTQTEWEEMIPAELMQYRDAKKVPDDIAKRYADHQFEMMAKLIQNQFMMLNGGRRIQI